MLKALLSRESLPSNTTCRRCEGERVARWRCQDCTAASLLCRACMRRSHMDNPLHRITVWTGSYFCLAQLWEAGVYILVPHHEGEANCVILKFHEDHLERFQETKDHAEDAALSRADPTAPQATTAEQEDGNPNFNGTEYEPNRWAVGLTPYINNRPTTWRIVRRKMMM